MALDTSRSEAKPNTQARKTGWKLPMKKLRVLSSSPQVHFPRDCPHLTLAEEGRGCTLKSVKQRVSLQGHTKVDLLCETNKALTYSFEATGAHISQSWKGLAAPLLQTPIGWTHRPAHTWGCLNSAVARDHHWLPKEMRWLTLPLASPFPHIPSAHGFVQFLFFLSLVGVKWIS